MGCQHRPVESQAAHTLDKPPKIRWVLDANNKLTCLIKANIILLTE